jgi:hypothetical protein
MRKRAIPVAILLLLGLLPAAAAIRIEGDGGGQIGAYLAKFRALRVR